MENNTNKNLKSIRHTKFYKNKILKTGNGHSFAKKKKELFLIKALIFSFFIFMVKLSQPFMADYFGNNDVYFIPFIENEAISLSDDGFIMQKSIQTQKRKKEISNKIIEYIIKKGDTISTISEDYQISLLTLLGANPVINPYKELETGLKIKILPTDGVLLELEKDEAIYEIATNYKINKMGIILQNKLSKDTLVLKKGGIFILPGAKPVLVSNADTYKNSIPTYVKNIKSFARSRYLIWPTQGASITQYFSSRHYALDIASVHRGPIFAATDGVVLESKSYGWNGGYGKMVLLQGKNGIKTRYAHNSRNYVKKGDKVKQGDTIAWMGNTGNVRGRTGIHVHFEVVINGVKRNPLAYIK